MQNDNLNPPGLPLALAVTGAALALLVALGLVGTDALLALVATL